MSTIKFTDFIKHLVVESLHPELHSIVTSKNNNASKQSLLAKKIKDLSSRGESTGIEGNMPTGSSRAYLKHDTPHKIVLDGKETSVPSGTKVAINATLDAHHDHKAHDGLSLGAMQNKAEGGDWWANGNYRILKHIPESGENHYKSNKDSGIFPPLLNHDDDHHEWSHVGHARDIKAGEFQKFTKNKEYPKGITHKDFYETLDRFHNRNNGKYWKKAPGIEAHLNNIEQHPLVQKFIDYHSNTGHPTYDYRQRKNLGVFEHPDGSQHIVARDHGFDTEVADAYAKATKKKYR